MSSRAPRVAGSKRRAGRGGGGGSVPMPAGLITQVRFRNRLPDVPFPAKLLRYPLDPARFAEYAPSTLEKQHQFVLHAPRDVAVPVDLVNDDAYVVGDDVVLDPRDAALLRDEAADGTVNDRRKRNMEKDITWLLRPDYISSETKGYGRLKTVSENRLDLKNLPERPNDREAQIAAIERTFTAAATTKPLRHPVRRGITAVEVAEVLPDFENWGIDNFETVFDADPVPVDRKDLVCANPEAQLEFGVIMGRDQSQGDVAGYYLPDAETTAKRRRRRAPEGGGGGAAAAAGTDDVQEGEKHTYHFVREYAFEIIKRSDGDEQVVFARRKGKVYYSRIPFNIRLIKQRMAQRKREVCTIEHRDYTPDELEKMAENRASLLVHEEVGVEEAAAMAAAEAVEGEEAEENAAAAAAEGEEEADWAIGADDVPAPATRDSTTE